MVVERRQQRTHTLPTRPLPATSRGGYLNGRVSAIARTLSLNGVRHREEPGARSLPPAAGSGLAMLRHRRSATVLPEARDESADMYRVRAGGAWAAFRMTCAPWGQGANCRPAAATSCGCEFGAEPDLADRVCGAQNRRSKRQRIVRTRSLVASIPAKRRDRAVGVQPHSGSTLLDARYPRSRNAAGLYVWSSANTVRSKRCVGTSEHDGFVCTVHPTCARATGYQPRSVIASRDAGHANGRTLSWRTCINAATRLTVITGFYGRRTQKRSALSTCGQREFWGRYGMCQMLTLRKAWDPGRGVSKRRACANPHYRMTWATCAGRRAYGHERGGIDRDTRALSETVISRQQTTGDEHPSSVLTPLLYRCCRGFVSKVNREIPGRSVKNLRNDAMSCECDIGCSLPLGTNHLLLSSLSPSVFQQRNGEPESRVNTGELSGKCHRMEWKRYWSWIVVRLRIVLKGWPHDRMPFVWPGKLSADDVGHLLELWKAGTLFFERIDEAEFKQLCCERQEGVADGRVVPEVPIKTRKDRDYVRNIRVNPQTRGKKRRPGGAIKSKEVVTSEDERWAEAE
ncbi:predicted protein [Postia placenta Mad-698-R]|nr:predicted protein [Postia placenta Mad-698-R]